MTPCVAKDSWIRRRLRSTRCRSWSISAIRSEHSSAGSFVRQAGIEGEFRLLGSGRKRPCNRQRKAPGHEPVLQSPKFPRFRLISRSRGQQSKPDACLRSFTWNPSRSIRRACQRLPSSFAKSRFHQCANLWMHNQGHTRST